jgi:membrane protease YdiL (CAAX protease family)
MAIRDYRPRKSFDMQTTPRAFTDGDAKRQARRGLSIYFAIVVALSAVIQTVIISRPDLDGLIAGLMLVPTLASVVARLALKEGFSDISFRFGGRRGGKAIVQALILPLLIGLLAYTTAWTTGLAHFDPPPLGSLIAVFAGGLVVSLVLVSGEEIGWRGYMLTRLIDSGVPRPVLASGLIWALWHVPLVVAGVYAAGTSPLLSAVLLVVGITSFGYVIARMRLETGSVWPAIVLHTAWNSIIIRGFDPATTGSGAMVWVGESGILTTLALVAAAVVFSRGRWTVLREPPKREAAPVQQEGVQAQPRVQ